MILICKKYSAFVLVGALIGIAILSIGGRFSLAETTEGYAESSSLNVVCALLGKDSTTIEGVPSADYVPDVDAYGRSVKSAHDDDLALQKSYRLNLSIDMASRYMDLPEGLEMRSEVIPLEITANGQILLAEEDRTQEFRALCAQHYGQ